MLPYAFRPLRDEYLAIAKIVSNDLYLNMDEKTFISAYMKHTNGSGNPRQARTIYYNLMKDAGIGLDSI